MGGKNVGEKQKQKFSPQCLAFKVDIIQLSQTACVNGENPHKTCLAFWIFERDVV